MLHLRMSLFLFNSLVGKLVTLIAVLVLASVSVRLDGKETTVTLVSKTMILIIT